MIEAKAGSHSEAARIARFMGLRNWKTVTDLGLIDRVRDGLPAETVETVAARIDPDGRMFAPTDIIPKSTWHRRKSKQSLTKDESEKVLAFSKVFTEALRLYHDDGRKVVQFMSSGHPMLGGRTPIDLVMGSISGADLVLKLMARADAGVST